MSNLKLHDAIHKEGGRKMTIYERESLEKELGQIDAQLSGTASLKNQAGEAVEQSRPDLLQNKAGLLARKRKLAELLNKDDDLKCVGDTQRGILSREARELEERVKKHMLTKRESQYRMGQRPQDYELAVQKTVEQQKTVLPLLQRWQEIMRQLFPDDPAMCDVRRIKPA